MAAKDTKTITAEISSHIKEQGGQMGSCMSALHRASNSACLSSTTPAGQALVHLAQGGIGGKCDRIGIGIPRVGLRWHATREKRQRALLHAYLKASATKP